MNTQRILKSGALALAVTALFAVFAYRLAEWSRPGDAGAVALVQTPTACGTAEKPVPELVKVIPQIPVGSFDGGLTMYSTAIEIVNTSGAAQTINAAFYKEDGAPLTSLSLPSGDSPLTNGVLAHASIEKDGILVINGEGSPARGVIGWGTITSCGRLSIAAFFELRDAVSHVLYSRVGLPASRPDMSSFVIPRVREISSGLDVGFALVNTAPGGRAVLRAELKDRQGNTLAAKDISMPGRSHQMGFTKDLFAAYNESGAGRNYQYVKFTSTSPTFAAIALAFEGGTQTSFPVDMIQ